MIERIMLVVIKLESHAKNIIPIINIRLAMMCRFFVGIFQDVKMWINFSNMLFIFFTFFANIDYKMDKKIFLFLSFSVGVFICEKK